MPMPIKTYSELQFVIPSYFKSRADLETRPSKPWVASFRLDQDVSDLFPYINAALDEATCYEQPRHVRFLLDGYRCRLYPGLAVAYFFESKTKVHPFIDRLIAFLNDLDRQKESITPNFDCIKHIPMMDILKILPKTNCRECGYLTCMAFAAALIQGKAPADRCPGLAVQVSENAVYPLYGDQGQVVNTLSLKRHASGLKNIIQAQQDKIAMLEAALMSHQQAEPPETPVKSPSSPDFGLTGREVEVLRLIAEGYSNNEIAGLLFISSHTVKSHMINIFNKLDVNDRTRAAVRAIREQII